MRLGWDEDCLNAPDIARRAEAAGVQMLTIHGRTRCQFYKGRANWAAIREVKDAVTIPVIANGDIIDVASARTALSQSGADGVMVGRGSQGAPWRLAEIAHALGWGTEPVVPRGRAFVDMVRAHFEETIAFYGVELGGRVVRKHLGWYMDHAGTEARLRKAVLTSDVDKVRRLLPEAMGAEVVA
jgi:tRNA-dihydrouridine synthase